MRTGKARKAVRVITRAAILVTAFLFVFGTGRELFGFTLPFTLTHAQTDFCLCVMGVSLIVSAGVRSRRRALRVLVGIVSILAGLMLI